MQGVANQSMVLWIDQLAGNSFHDQIVIPSRSNAQYISPSTQIAFGRINFAQGYFSEATAYFEQADNLGKMTPFALAEMAIALSQTDRFEEVIALYEMNGKSILWSDAARDAVLTAYLWQLDQNRQTVADVSPKLQELAPQALFVKRLSLLQQFDVKTIAELPYEAQMELARFPIESVLPTDERILAYLAQVVPELVENDIWDIEKLVNVIELWIWQYPNSLALNDLIDTVSVQYEKEFDWDMLEDELDLRRKQRKENEASVLISEGIDQVTNMLPNGGFGMINYEGIVGWHEADYITGPGEEEPQAAFLMDVDDTIYISSPFALRLDGIWNEAATGFFGAVAIGSKDVGTYLLAIEPETPYRISGYYQTRGDSEQVSVYVGNPEFGLIDENLPATSQTWQKFDFIGCHLNGETESMQLLLRLYNSGTVWFDDVVIRPANSSDCAENCS